ncbi:hypothetical protein K440DRAFT_605886 [Wilcoxina mikolae CBS 423.85]|nr:hypothetical protein K440DRAFT_605886 [Wilcoxina mikolae CBS 423.85]
MSVKPILYHYHFSPYAHKLLYYLTLRSLPYLQCPQPPTLPRPDLSQHLGITYRRIPLLSIGNTVLIDTPLILSELERRFPDGALGGGEKAKEWSRWSDKVFTAAMRCIPVDLPAMKDAGFRRDREDFSGEPFQLEAVERNRERSLKGLEEGFKRTEEALGDGRKWVLGGDGLSLADINALWVLEWMIHLPGALAGSEISEGKYPYTFAWVSRFLERMGKVVRAPVVTGVEARDAILGAEREDFGENEEGEMVAVSPVDTGKNHPQIGVLRKRDAERVVLEVVPPGEERSLRIVFPTEGFEVVGIGGREARL